MVDGIIRGDVKQLAVIVGCSTNTVRKALKEPTKSGEVYKLVRDAHDRMKAERAAQIEKNLQQWK